LLPACKFMDKLIQQGKAVLVFSDLGISRSVAVIIAYLMYRRGYALNTAYEYVKGCRQTCCPNQAFLEQLAAWVVQNQDLFPCRRDPGADLLRGENLCVESESESDSLDDDHDHDVDDDDEGIQPESEPENEPENEPEIEPEIEPGIELIETEEDDGHSTRQKYADIEEGDEVSSEEEKESSSGDISEDFNEEKSRNDDDIKQ